MRIIYSFFIRCFYALIALAAWLGNSKAKAIWKGRKSLQHAVVSNNDDKWVWFHVSSLGEFEQGRPLIEKIKESYPQYKILLTFFSPSGYEIRKNYPLADVVAYLPADTLKNACRLLDKFDVKLAVFVKYEFWFNYIKVLSNRNIPLYYISVLFRPSQYFFKWYGLWFRRQLKLVDSFFVQDQTSVNLLQSIGAKFVTLTGDTRFDRVADIARRANRFSDIEKFIAGRKCIIAGSTWPPDEALISSFLPTLPDDYCIIIAPHDISQSHVNQIIHNLSDYQLYTSFDASQSSKILIINTIGILSQLYQYARFVYVGGGFGVKIHNIQEPITFGCPVVIGPKYCDFKEAVDLVKANGVFTVSNQSEFDAVFNRLIHDDDFCSQASKICKQYVESQVGATQKIMQHLAAVLE